MKKIFALVLALALTLSLTAALADPITIAVPNDPTNEGRALLLLQSNPDGDVFPKFWSALLIKKPFRRHERPIRRSCFMKMNRQPRCTVR